MSKIEVVKTTRIEELFNERYWEENTAGIIIKKINGFLIPPVRKNKIPNCIMS